MYLIRYWKDRYNEQNQYKQIEICKEKSEQVKEVLIDILNNESISESDIIILDLKEQEIKKTPLSIHNFITEKDYYRFKRY